MERALYAIVKYATDNHIWHEFRLSSHDPAQNSVTTQQYVEGMIIRGQLAIIATGENYRMVWRMVAQRTITGKRGAINIDYPIENISTPDDVAIVFETFLDTARQSFKRVERQIYEGRS